MKNKPSRRTFLKSGLQAGLAFPFPGTSLSCDREAMYDWWYSDALSEGQRHDFELDPETVLMQEKAIIGAWKEIEKR